MEKNSKDRSIVVAVAGYFTAQWFVQTVAAWAFSMWLTKMWKKYKSNKES